MRFSRFLKIVTLGSLLAVSLPMAQAALSTEQRLADFSQLVNIIERNYAPLRWKKETIGLDWAKVVREYQSAAGSARSDAEFYRVLARFIAELKDSHVSAVIPSTHQATLGFVADVVEGRVLLETIDRLRLPDLLFPFQRGDELIAIGGRPVAELMAELKRANHTGHEPSANRIAAARLTTRREAVGVEVPRGVTTVTVMPKGADRPLTVTATWIVSGVPVIDLDSLASMVDDRSALNAVSTAGELDLVGLFGRSPIFNLSLPRAQLDEWTRAGVTDIGAKKSMFKLPEGAVAVPGISVTAAVYPAGGKRIGVLRINSYMENSLLEELARAVLLLEPATDVLVLDQTNNPGGSVALVSNIVSLFADRSFQDANFMIRPSLSWVKAFQDMNTAIRDALKANPEDATANAFRARFDFMESEVRDALAKRQFLTSPFSLNYSGSFGMIQPAGMVRYTKPVLLLINEFDFSGGDMFPAIMKDNGRARLFGAQTSGAGGNVAEHGPLANSFFKLQLTESLMVRPNGEFVENRGVKPDVEYQVTEDDFLNGYRNYVAAFTAEALQLTGLGLEEAKAAGQSVVGLGANR